MVMNPRNPGVTSPHPKSKIDPQLTRLAIPRLPISLANLGSLSEEMEEAFGNIAKARQDDEPMIDLNDTHSLSKPSARIKKIPINYVT